MFGFLYLGMAIISDIGAKIKEYVHDSNAKVDRRTNTYIDYYGTLRDAKTKEFRYWTHDLKGNEVLKNKKHRVVKNITEEQDQIKLNKARRTPNEKTVCDLGRYKECSYTDGFGFVNRKKKILYLDKETGKELITIYVPEKFTYRKKEMEFYAYANNPLHVVRISDGERRLESVSKDKNNWIAHPEYEQLCIDKFNNAPIGKESWCKCIIKW